MLKPTTPQGGLLRVRMEFTVVSEARDGPTQPGGIVKATSCQATLTTIL